MKHSILNSKSIVGVFLASMISLTLWGCGSKVEKPTTPSPIAFKVSEKLGDAAFSANGQVWETAEKGTALPAGSSVKTNAGAKVILYTPQGGVVRLNENAELKMNAVAAASADLTQNAGRTYQWVPKTDGLSYQVNALGHVISVTAGAVFDLSVNAASKRINVKVLEGEVLVKATKYSAGQTLTKGKEITLGSDNKLLLADVNTDYTSGEWYLWNKSEDKKVGHPVSFEVAPVKTAEPAKTTTTTTTTPKTTTTTTTKTTTTTYGTGTCKPSLSVKKGLNNMGVQLNWSTCNSADFQFYKILRSTTNPNLSYPATAALMSSSNKFFTSYLDKNIAIATTYYYRVCVVEVGPRYSCGNVAKFLN